jgi:hypothetical protein
MTVNHFGPFTIEEELEMRAETLSREIDHATEKREEAKRTLECSQAEIDRLEKLRDDYVRVLKQTSQGKSVGVITAKLRLDTTEFDRDLARAKKRSHN